MKRIPLQTLLPFGRKERVVNRQIREKAAGKKVQRGPGRPRSGRTVMPHDKRRAIDEKTAVHVTLNFTKKVPNLRSRKKYNLVKRAFAAFSFVSADVRRRVDSQQAASQRGTVKDSKGEYEQAEATKQQGFRLVHFAVLGNHLHLLCEADSAQWLSKGVQKLTISLARLLNADGVRAEGGSLDPRAGAFQTRPGWIGKIFSERYHAHYLQSEREMRQALVYLFENSKRHYGTMIGETFEIRTVAGRIENIVIDVFTSFAEMHGQAGSSSLIVKPRGFLLRRTLRSTFWATRHE